MKMSRLDKIACILLTLCVIFWTPFFSWFIEILSPTAKLYVLNAFVFTVSIKLFKLTHSSQSFKKRIAFRMLAAITLIFGILSQLYLTLTTIPRPLDSCGLNADDHNIVVGSHVVEGRKTRVLNLSSAGGEIVVREIKPICWGIRLVKNPIAIGDTVTDVVLRRINNNSFSYQFIGEEYQYVEEPVEYKICTVRFKN